MIVYNFKDNLSCILGLGGISIDMICNSQENKLRVYNLFRIRQAMNRKDEEDIEALNSRYFKWVKDNL